MLIHPITASPDANVFWIEATSYVKSTVNFSPVGANPSPYITINYTNGRDIGYGLRRFDEFTMNGVTPASRQELLDWADDNLYLKGQDGQPGASYPGISEDRTLTDNAQVPAVSVDWNARLLKRANGTTAMNWAASTLNDATSAASVNFADRTLLSSTGAVSINWSARQFYDGANVMAIDLNQRRLLRGDGQRSIDWSNNRNSIRDDQNYMSVIWGYSTYFDSVPGKYTGNRLLIDGKTYYGRGAVSVAWHDRVLFDENENPAASWSATARNLQQYNGNVTLDWANLQLNDSNAVMSADWGNRVLRDQNTQYSVDWRNRALIAGGATVVDWDYGTLNTQTGNLSVDWANRTLITETNVNTLQWDTDDGLGGTIVSMRGSNAAAFGLDYGFTDGAGAGTNFGAYQASGELYILLRSGAAGGIPRVVRIPYAD